MADTKFRYGWQPDLPDQRDSKFKVSSSVVRALPASVDLRKKCPAVYDQESLGSCTANAIGAAFQFNLMKQKFKNFVPSRLFIYYNERVLENSVQEDAGAMLRDGMKTINKDGVCNEDTWPYKINKFATTPPPTAYTEALDHQALSYQRVERNIKQMKGCLAQGYPFVFGFTVYESFESDYVASTGKMPMPEMSESKLGGHAVMAVGYNDKTGRFIIRNSWSAAWGMKGYFTMPYDYLLNPDLSDDFWTIRIVE